MIYKLISHIFIFFILFLAFCKEPEFPGFKLSDNNIYYKIHVSGDSSKKANINDYLVVDIVYQTMKDSVFFQARRKVQITNPEYQGSIDYCFAMLYVGDSASFIIDAYKFFNFTLRRPLPAFINEEEKFKVSAKVFSVKTPEEFEMEKKEFLSWIDDFSEYEQVLLTHYIQKEQISVDPTNSGLYHIIIKKGNEIKVELGDTLEVHYEGRFLNGKIFDSTWERESAFEFVYGQEWQVIKGLEEAIGKMTEGEESFFIMPSQIAFGKTGSSTGIIPPFTSVIFKVQILKIKKANNSLDSLNQNL
ncbi:MAG: FKBP-type peptidyl-prolyl cis-trans isomerase [Bacteroidota bacterium]